MATLNTVTLRDLLSSWELADISASDPGMLDHVGLDDFAITDITNGTRIQLTLSFADELGFTFPGLDCLGLYFGSRGSTNTITVQCEISQTVSIRLVSVSATLRFKSSLLHRVIPKVGGGYQPVLEPDGSPAPAQIVMSGIDVLYTVGSSLQIVGGPQLSLPPTMIGDTGIVIESQTITLHLNRDAAPPPGASAGFIGVHIASAAIHLPDVLAGTVPNTLAFTNARIGSDGFSGTVTAPSLSYSGTLGAAQFALTSVSLSFERNVLTGSALRGELRLPFFDQPLELEFGIAGNGGILVRLSSATGAIVEKANVARLKIKAVALDATTSDAALEISGSLQPLVPGVQWPEIDVTRLRIHTDGRIENPGGWLTLPAQKSVGFFGFPLEIRKIGFGSQGAKRWVGFSGGLKLVDGMPVGGSVEGLKILWDPNNLVAPPELELREVTVAVRVPNTLSIDGSVSFYQDAGKNWFQGSGTVDLKALGVTLDAQLLVGRTAEYTFFYVFVEAGLPAGIPLFSTGLALYGLGGLVGVNVEPDRRDAEPWYDGWYKRTPDGPTAAAKWRDAGNRFAVGASVTLGTLPDNGFALHGRVLVVVLIPGPTVMVEGRLNLIKDRKGMTSTSEPRFRGLAVLDGEAGTLMVNLEPKFLSPDQGTMPGSLIDITGMAEAFFDFQRGDRWYLHLGKKDPRERRIRARLLSLFDANAYLMLDPRQVAVGAMVGYDAKFSYGPVSLRLAYWFEADALLEFRPLQLTANAGLHGRAELRAFGIGLSIVLDATAHVETPEPFLVTARVHVKADLPWPIPDVDITIPFEYRESIPPALPVPLQHIDMLTHKASECWDTASQEPGQTIPMDSRPILVFSKAMHDEKLIGSNVQPAGEEHSGELTFSYHLDDVVVERKVQGTWTAVAGKPAPTGGRELFGMWLPTTAGDGSAPNAKLQLFAKTPFEAWGQASTDAAAEAFASSNPGYPWVYDRMDFEGTPVGTVIGASPAATVIDGLEFDAGALIPAPIIVATSGVRDLEDAEAIGARALLLRQAAFGYVAGGGSPTGTVSTTGSTLRFSLRISFPASVHPDGVRSVRMHLSTRSVLSLVARDTSGNVVATRIVRDDTRANIFTLHGTQHCWIVLTADNIRHVDIDYGPTWIHSIEWVPAVATVSNAAALSNHNAAETARWSEDEFLFAPHSSYRIRATCRVRVTRSSGSVSLPDHPDAGPMGPASLPAPNLHGTTADYTFEQIAYMRTEGPPGFLGTEIDRSVTGGRPTMPPGSGTPQGLHSRMRTLEAYVSRVHPADPERPFYRAYDLSIEFNESYISRMYGDDQRSLTLDLRDPNGQGPGASAAPSTVTAVWRDADASPMRPNELQWVNLLKSGGGPTLPGATRPAWDALDVSIRAPLLLPDTRYQALLTAVPDTGISNRELYRFTVRTSRYACFAHHIGSFDGRIDVMDQPLPTLSAADRTRLLASAKSGTDSDFTDIVEMFGLSLQTRPDRLRCMVLTDTVRKYGFLISSPEPLDRERISLSLSWFQRSMTPERQVGPFRILEVHGGDHTNAAYNGEWVDLMALDTLDLGGYRLAQKIGTGAPTVLYTIPAGLSVDEGEVVRVHAGSEPRRRTVSDSIIHLYRSSHGTPASWMLNLSESEIVLVDGQGRPAGAIAIPPAWIDRTAYFVWNHDNTRLLVLPEARPLGCFFAWVQALPPWLQQWLQALLAQPSINLDSGTYRLEWQYAADISMQKPQTPLLRRKGIIADESAVTQFRVP